jgi:protein-S-isoprenylcysteine O-methyltransferase Ste14
MQSYFAASTIILMIAMVVARAQTLRKQGIKAINFGNLDKKDFLIPPFALFFFYLVFANAFKLPSIRGQELFQVDAISWIGVFFCLAGLAILLWSLISFRKSFRVGIDVHHSDDLITTGVFALSRNPIYVSFASILLGQFLVFPSWIVLAYLAAGVLLFHRQVLREEAFLGKHYGEEYTKYCRRVRRYI